jgi:hypothetical protein
MDETLSSITEQDLAILKRREPDELAKWWCLLNRWEWPPELPDEESTEVYCTFLLDKGGPGVRESRRGQIMRWIEQAVSPRALSREWNREMPDDYFNDFWRGHHEGDAEALERYRVRAHEESLLHVRTRNLSREGVK